MKIAAVEHEGIRRLGTVANDGLRLLRSDIQCAGDLVRSGEAAAWGGDLYCERGTVVAAGTGDYLCPFLNFKREFFCTGWNYFEHFEEGKATPMRKSDAEMPLHPTFFTKSSSTAIGPYEDMVLSEAISSEWDYEAEIAIIISRSGIDIHEDSASDHIFGYTLANDISARDLQRRHGGQWFKGKSIDGTMPIGPFIVTKDETDFADIRFTCSLNGAVMQDGHTCDMAFPVERLIAELSVGFMLRPGDIILTGTPAGVGFARKPPVYLRSGDVVAIDGGEVLGRIENRVVDR